MEFSDEWRSLWPVSSVFAAPILRPSAAAAADPVGPLLFSPSPLPPLPLLSSPSLALDIPAPLPASSFVEGLRSFFHCPANEAFLPSAAVDALAIEAAVSVPGPSASASDPIPCNNLAALRCHNGSSMVLFFPTGPNANLIGYVGVSFRGLAPPELGLDRDGDVFKLREGYKHPYHRIVMMSTVAATQSSWAPEAASASPGNPLIEGFLIATTLYSVNWFSIETRVTGTGQERPFLVPMAKQGFESAVVHACWSPHFVEESAALLESGDLCWFNLQTKRGGTMRVALPGEVNPGEWLSCEFGGQPWTVIVACSKAVVLVDLRSTKGTEHKVLAHIKMSSSLYVSPLIEMNDRFIAFGKASYNDFHIALVTEHRLLLFDVRKPLAPLLTWNHRMDSPHFIAMLRLSELRPSNEFKWASESGYVILIGSFWNNEFTLFCYGPRKAGCLGNSSLFAWELPSSLPLSDNGCESGDSFVREIFSAENSAYGSVWRQREKKVAGLCIVPNDIFPVDSESGGGFSLIRLTLSGKLEMQRYHASSKLYCQETNFTEADQLKEVDDSVINSEGRECRLSSRCEFYRLWYLSEYMNGNLSNALAMRGPQANYKETCQISLGHDMNELISHILKSSNLSMSAFANEVSIPTSIFEVACRRTLNCLQSDILPLAFSKYSDLFRLDWASTFEFLEIPWSLSQKRSLPFFAGKPSRRSEKWSSKTLFGDALVGPVLPVPVLLALQQNDKKDGSFTFKDNPDDDLLDYQCRTVLKDVLPEISIADTRNCNGWGATDELQAEKSYFLYEPTQAHTSSASERTNIDAASKADKVYVKTNPFGFEAAARSKIRHLYIEHLRVLHCWFQVRPQRGSSRPAARNEALLVHTTAASHSFSKWKVDYLMEICATQRVALAKIRSSQRRRRNRRKQSGAWKQHIPSAITSHGLTQMLQRDDKQLVLGLPPCMMESVTVNALSLDDTQIIQAI
ncbi:unnamed protein product [Musa hybrid cultivar]